MKLEKTFKSLCSPARFYLGVSVFLVILILIQNLLNADSQELCVGVYKCDIPHIGLFFIIKLLYIAFWTCILNVLCAYGLKTLSWFLVLVPFLLFAIVLALIIFESVKSKRARMAQEQSKQKQSNQEPSNQEPSNQQYSALVQPVQRPTGYNLL